VSVVGIQLDVLPDQLAELLCGLDGLQATIEFDCRPNISMPEEAAHCLVVARSVLEVNRGCSMAKLVHRDAKSGRFLNSLGDLLAKVKLLLRLTGFAREEPGGVCAAQQRGPEVMDVFVDEVCQRVVELKSQIDPILYVIVWENEPVGSSSRRAC